MAEELVGIASPEFAKKVQRKHQKFFTQLPELRSVAKQVVGRQVSEQLHLVLRHLAGGAMNSANATIALCLNGYGPDAMRICRAMFEAGMTAQYLAKYPQEIRDYLDYRWVSDYKQLQYFRKFPSAAARGISPKLEQDIEKGYQRVKERFLQGRPSARRTRNRWCKHSLAEMAKKVGRQQDYEAYYPWLSSLMHQDFGGLATQLDPLTLEPSVAPSMHHIDSALQGAHTELLVVLGIFNDGAELGMHEEVQGQVNEYVEIWGPHKIPHNNSRSTANRAL